MAVAVGSAVVCRRTALEKATTRRNISTKVPDRGRFDQLVSAVTWKSTSQPRPDWTADTSGVPSPSAATVADGPTVNELLLAYLTREVPQRYGGERSAPFVNGLAESLARRLRPAAQR